MDQLLGTCFSVIFTPLSKLLFRTFSSEFVYLFQGKQFIDDQIKPLNKKLEKASRLRNDAERRQLKEPNVKKWLDELKDVIYRAQDLVDEIEFEAQRSNDEPESESNTSSVKKLMNMISKRISFYDFVKTVQGEIANILNDLSRLLDDEVARGLKVEDAHNNITAGGASSQTLDTPRKEAHDRVRGRDADKKKIMDLLLSNDVRGGKVGVLAIVGMDGLGKTTLAQLVYNDGRWKELDFTVKVWVIVSTNFNSSAILEAILQQVVSSQSTSNIKERTEHQRKLSDALKDKKFLIVLDDAWDENYDSWDVLRSNFEFGRRESRVIVTTRSSAVASNVNTGKIQELCPIPYDDCWQIFVDHAFNGDSNAYTHLQATGKKLVEKCGGLPLALKSLGGLLRSKKDPKYWERILHNPVWKTNKILPFLWLSYCYLPSNLKQCFAYCSVFPKGYGFRKEKIILLWMAEGFLQADTMEEVGEEYFDGLISRSLLQRSSQDKSKFVMHDLMHDLAMSAAGEFCFAVDDEKSLNLLTDKTRHFSNTKFVDYDSVTEALSKAKHLRTFIGLRGPHDECLSNQLIEEFLAERRCLRVLSLQHVAISLLPDSISNQKNLRYLDLSNTGIEGIPCSICTLHNLQTLLLSNCYKLKRLPNEMGRLINLRHLETTQSPLEEMPPRMGNLKKLQTLTDFVLGEVHDNASSITELRELEHLGGKLRISGLQNVVNMKNIEEANLRGKKNLTELHLVWEGDTSDTTMKQCENVLDALEPHTNLEKLKINRYASSIFPRWIGDSQLSNIISMTLIDNENCCSLPPLGQLPSLQFLSIKNFHGVETISDEFYGDISSGVIPFQSLKSLVIECFPKWKKWSFIGNPKDGGCFPRLKFLWLEECPNATNCYLITTK